MITKIKETFNIVRFYSVFVAFVIRNRTCKMIKKIKKKK